MQGFAETIFFFTYLVVVYIYPWFKLFSNSLILIFIVSYTLT